MEEEAEGRREGVVKSRDVQKRKINNTVSRAYQLIIIAIINSLYSLFLLILCKGVSSLLLFFLVLVGSGDEPS